MCLFSELMLDKLQAMALYIKELDLFPHCVSCKEQTCINKCRLSGR